MTQLRNSLRKLAYLCLLGSVLLTGCSHSAKPTASGSWSGAKVDHRKAAILNVEMGEKYLQQGQVSRAKTKLLHALELSPNLPEGLSALGFYYENVGEEKLAEQYYKKAVRYGRGQGAFLNNYGTYLCRQDRYPEAETAFVQAAADQQYTKTAEVYENAGLCAKRAALPGKAERFFRMALRHDPLRPTAPLELATHALQANNFRQALNFLKQYKSHHVPTARSVYLGIRIHRGLHNKDAEASDVLLLKNQFKNSPEYQRYLELAKNE